MQTKILILGDLYPNNINSFPKLLENDFCVANLECAITDHDVPIKKDGPSLRISPEKISILNSLGINLVGLANNHVFDFGVQGFKDTCEILEKNNISYAGSSAKLSSYSKQINNKKLCFYFVSEHQFNYFSNNVGVNLLELERCFKEVSELKKSNDVVFVMFHGGREYYEYPTPKQQEICRKFVDSGASIVICQHSHCVGCKETYKNSTIIYGQGNFAFPYRDNEFFKIGLIIEAVIGENNNVNLQYIPIMHEIPGTIEIATENKAKDILDGFFERSEILKIKSVEELYSSFVDENGFEFLYKLLNKGKFYTRLDTSRFFKNRMLKRYIRKNQDYFAYLYNYFNCETHVEYIKAIIERHVRKGEK